MTRPDSRDAPHLFGVGLKEMLADEITADLRAIRDQAGADARAAGTDVRRNLVSKGIAYGSLLARRDGTIDAAGVRGVDADLRVRPFFAHGGKFSLREFVVGALNDEMGLQAVDRDLAAASAGGRVVTPSGLVLDGRQDAIAAPPAPLGAGGSRWRRAGERDPGKPGRLPRVLPAQLLRARDLQVDPRHRAGPLAPAADRVHVLPRARPAARADRRVADVETAYTNSAGSSTACSPPPRRCSRASTTAPAIRRSSSRKAARSSCATSTPT